MLIDFTYHQMMAKLVSSLRENCGFFMAHNAPFILYVGVNFVVCRIVALFMSLMS